MSVEGEASPSFLFFLRLPLYDGRMRLTSWITPHMILITFILSGCSVYESQGRKDFESNVGGRTQTNVGISSVIATSECWIQAKNQPLWTQNQNSILIIKSLNETQMSVCQGRADETPTP